MKLPEALSRKVGPLPVGAWIVAVAGGIGVAVVIRRQAFGAETADAAAEAAELAGMDGTDWTTEGTGGAAWSDPANPGNVSDPVAPGGSATGAPISTNNQWRVQAVKVLVGRGRSAITAEIAVGRYLRGKTLSRAQANMISTAIAVLGPTPRPVPTPTVRAPRKPKPKRHTHVHRHRSPSGPKYHRHEHTEGQHHGPERRDRGTDTNPGR